MSIKNTSMPSINESINDEDETEKIHSQDEEISTSDYSSLKRERKEATLTKSPDVMNDQVEDDELEEMKDKVATLRNNASNSNDLERQPDRYGFFNNGSHYTDPDSDLVVSPSVLRSRERKWQQMLSHWSQYCSSTGHKSRKLINRCRKGIPQSMRARVWQLLVGIQSADTERQLYIMQKQQQEHYQQQMRPRLPSRISLRSLKKDSSFSRQSLSSTAAAPPRYGSLEVPSNQHEMSISGSTNSSINREDQQDNYSNNSSLGSGGSIAASSRASMPINSVSQSLISLPQHESHKRNNLYETYCKIRPSQEVVDQINKDIHRQFPDHESFNSSEGLGQKSLATLLTAYSVRRPETGYCQGMAPVAAALLMIMPEQDAFWTFDRILDKYIPGYYDVGLRQIQIDAKALLMLLKKENYSIYRTFKHSELDPICFMVDWFMCLFIRTLPWPSVVLVLDMFLCEGKTILFKIALILIAGSVHNNNTVAPPDSPYDSDWLLTCLRNLPAHITTPQYITTQLSKCSISKVDVRRELDRQYKLMFKPKK